LREAYKNEPDPTLLYNLGRACEGMGDDPCAIDAYERYLKEASPPDRGAIEKKIAIMRARSAPKPAPKAPEPAAPAVTAKPASPWPFIATGAGAALVGSGVVLVFFARGKHESAANDPVQESAAAKQDSAEAQLRVGNVLLVAGGVVAAAGITWFVLESRKQNATVAIGPSSVSLSVHF
jgi:hypothetical protein